MFPEDTRGLAIAQQLRLKTLCGVPQTGAALDRAGYRAAMMCVEEHLVEKWETVPRLSNSAEEFGPFYFERFV